MKNSQSHKGLKFHRTVEPVRISSNVPINQTTASMVNSLASNQEKLNEYLRRVAASNYESQIIDSETLKHHPVAKGPTRVVSQNNPLIFKSQRRVSYSNFNNNPQVLILEKQKRPSYASQSVNINREHNPLFSNALANKPTISTPSSKNQQKMTSSQYIDVQVTGVHEKTP